MNERASMEYAPSLALAVVPNSCDEVTANDGQCPATRKRPQHPHRWVLAIRTLIAIILRTARKTFEDDMLGLASELAYRFFLALFPFFIFLAAVGGFIATTLNVTDPTGAIMDTIGTKLPANVASVIEDQIREVVAIRRPELLYLGMIGTLWAASAGINSAVKAMNRAYGVRETRPFWRRLPVTFALTTVGGIVIVAAFLLLVLGEFYGQQWFDALGLGEQWEAVLTTVRWTVVLLLVMSATASLYWAAPNTRVRFVRVTPGALLFAAGWFIATYGFSLFLRYVSDHNATYGSLASATILLVWFYLTSLVLVVGAELNAVLDTSHATATAPQPGPRTHVARLSERSDRGSSSCA